MSIKKTLLMLFINYILIILWLALFRLGFLSALVMLPLIILAITLNYLLLNGREEVRFWCMNLLGSTLIGIGLSSYMYARYIDPDRLTYVYMVIEMATFTVIILISIMVAGRMNAKRVRRRRALARNFSAPAEQGSGSSDKEDTAAGIAAGRLAQSYIDEAAEEAASQMEEDEAGEEAPQAKFKMVVKGRGNNEKDI